MKKIALAVPAVLGVGSAFAQDAVEPSVTEAFTKLTAQLDSVSTSLGGVQTAVIAIAVGVAVIVVSRAVIKRFLKL